MHLEESITPDELFNQLEKRMCEMSECVKEFPRAIELLSALQSHGIPIALATSNSKSVVESKMTQYPKLFSFFSTISITQFQIDKYDWQV
ncbi:unnamed protein product [Peronospora belbahrii]|uniref:Uncharacterized protein n=1 Tax=Peronospora belbahrii TaxID=622444 RepID=A0ABN8D769_9STRA|nr:unnamed protein product [Peronospora belbahrii]